ncbi:hypothetical protein DV515_00006936 [Chloebia gouldiae]|uniref:Uncharacterized protein n=1 Tax=Chloebia gouldiae TaxID=44316 RepID=A0A3L8SIX0_CHLGU|nr:hypothetical protein DV515_00006936 [Chloebia gouldiae]
MSIVLLVVVSQGTRERLQGYVQWEKQQFLTKVDQLVQGLKKEPNPTPALQFFMKRQRRRCDKVRARVLPSDGGRIARVIAVRQPSGRKTVLTVFRTDLITAMKIPDSFQLSPDEYYVLADPWRQEWEKGVQVPASAEAIPEPVVRLETCWSC